jgi:DNA-binding transcriptional LysR family regulator
MLRSGNEMPLELKDLRAFVAVAEEMHFGRAAARLHISAPPLTRQIQKMERLVGARLFDRTKRTVVITAAGSALLSEARGILEQAEKLPDTAQRAAQGQSGVLQVGVNAAALFSQTKEVQRKILQDLPNIRVIWRVLSSMDQITAIRQGSLDLGFVHTPIEHEGLSVRRMLREPLTAALPTNHPLANRQSIRLKDLHDQVFLIGARNLSPHDYDRLINACTSEGFTPKLDHQTQSMMSYLGLVAIGAGITITPTSMAEVKIEGVTYVRIEGPEHYSEISIAWDPRNITPVLARFLKGLSQSGSRKAK